MRLHYSPSPVPLDSTGALACLPLPVGPAGRPCSTTLLIFAAAADPRDRKPPRSVRSPQEWQHPEPDPGLAPYRGSTVALLRRYARMAVEQGRLPSIIGREFFRAKVSSARLHTFEDDVIFTFDIERCLQQLVEFDRAMLAHIVLEEYTQEDAAVLLAVTRRTIYNRFPRVLDELSQILLRRGLLPPLPGDERFSAVKSQKMSFSG